MRMAFARKKNARETLFEPIRAPDSDKRSSRDFPDPHDCDSGDSDNLSGGDAFDDGRDDRKKLRAPVQERNENIGIDIDPVAGHHGDGPS